MHLRSGETIIRVVKRHKTPYFIKLLGVGLVALPIYILIGFLFAAVSSGWVIGLFVVFSFFLGIIVGIVSLDYLLDKLVMTSRRLVWVNWKSIFKKEEHEVELLDIQDVETLERGIIAKIPGFNYGTLIIETAASKTAIVFHDCPNPDAIEHYLVVQTEMLRTSTQTH